MCGSLIKAKLPNTSWINADTYYFRPTLVSSDNHPQKKVSDMSYSFTALCKSTCGLNVPNVFIMLASKGYSMVYLQGSRQTNALYNIAKGFGEYK